MKKIKFILVSLTLMALPFAMTSCDNDYWDDPYYYDYYDYYGDWYNDYDWYNNSFDYGTNQLNEEAQMLRGHWEGSLVNYYTADDGSRQSAQMDVDIEFDQYDSKSLNGRGKEVDYVGNESQTLKFSWYIDPRTGDIFIKYDGSKYTFKLDINAKEDGFYLDASAFYGTMIGQNNDELIDFDLTRTTLAKPAAGAVSKTSGASFGKATANGKTRTASAPMKFRKR